MNQITLSLSQAESIMTNVLFFVKNGQSSLKMVLIEVVILSENKFILWILSVLPKVQKKSDYCLILAQMSESRAESVNFIETLEIEMCFRSSFLEFVG